MGDEPQMCGIVGIWRLGGRQRDDQLKDAVKRMSDKLVHRGPDSGGLWADADAGIGLGQRRLSIIDLSPAGAQPMVSSCGQLIISYNGELYNTPELRAGLLAKGRNFRGTSDTEVIVEACAEYGVSRAVRMLQGMFAISLWDRKSRSLYLVRDRVGIKPLYWGRFQNQIIFGSELKALIAAGGWSPEVDRTSLSQYFQFGYISPPRSIWRGVCKMTPGTILHFDQNGNWTEDVYWSGLDVATDGIRSRASTHQTSEEYTDKLEAVLDDSVSRHMVSDVPLGAFLSGGVDSSLVVALMQKQSSKSVKTFSIGFDEEEYNEANHARAVAEHLNTDHTELIVRDRDAQSVIPELPTIFDEPLGDPSQIPTYLVSALAKKHVTVALSGDGGDELFAGYSRYQIAQSIARKAGVGPDALLNGAAIGMRALSPTIWNKLLRLTPLANAHNLPGDRLHKLAGVIEGGKRNIYQNLVTNWPNASGLVIDSGPVDGIHKDDHVFDRFSNLQDYMQYIDIATYLCEDILTKVDRASMAVSLESRVPLLDHHVIEHAWSLPQHLKVKDGSAKWILREVLYRHVPKSLIERPKMGFGVPIDHWLRGPLRDWSEALLDERRLKAEGYLHAEPIRKCWQEHLSGERNMRYRLWSVLMFQSWLEQQEQTPVELAAIA